MTLFHLALALVLANVALGAALLAIHLRAQRDPEASHPSRASSPARPAQPSSSHPAESYGMRGDCVSSRLPRAVPTFDQEA